MKNYYELRRASATRIANKPKQKRKQELKRNLIREYELRKAEEKKIRDDDDDEVVILAAN